MSKKYNLMTADDLSSAIHEGLDLPEVGVESDDGDWSSCHVSTKKESVRSVNKAIRGLIQMLNTPQLDVLELIIERRNVALSEARKRRKKISERGEMLDW